MTNSTHVKQNEPSSAAYNVELRILLMAQWFNKGRNDWKALEEATGIKAVKWRHVQAGVTRPSLEMLEALCKLFPEHAFWLSTGLTDYEAGHTAPQPNLAFPGSFGTFLPNETPYSTEYFRTCMSALEAVAQSLVRYIEKRRTENRPNAGEATLTKAELASLFRVAINTSIQLGATEVSSALGNSRHRELTERIVSARKHHIEVMLERLREIGYVDTLIDQQRSQERELDEEFKKTPE
ncbi:hypothetical protein [Trinickia sp. EG282A]|uniref:hypothetical protein n=1 Tax=Trinickia sp. EG282A TaxID=3237013 RepID=UPI0034D36CCF